ncbi:MAG: hypothetical protein JWL77_5766 [Chthonomonadaceae bacterium]|nr:hypothetical protein [Chthonomonadaceae bacterium]
MQMNQHASRMFLSKRPWVSLLALLAVVALCSWIRVYLFSPLPRGAYPVLSTAEWARTDSREPNYTPFQWLPNDDLAHLERDRRGNLQVCYQKVGSSGPIGPLRRGLQIPAPPNMPTGFKAFGFSSSPDEKWIACVWDFSPTFSRTVLLTADGRITRAIPDRFSDWFSDSRSFLAQSFQSVPTLEVSHLDSPRKDKISPLTPEGSIIPVSRLTDSPNFLIGGRISNWPQAQQAENYPTMTLRSFRVSQPDVVQQTWQASVPRDISFGMAFASPDNKHLLWYTGTQRTSLLSAWLHRLLPARPVVPRTQLSWFLSDLEGKNMHPILEGGPSRDPSILGGWTPDSKHVSFIYKNQLYLVPVD